MEGPLKRYKVVTTVTVSWLNLHLWVQQRDIRKKIYRLLNSIDWQIVQFAHTGKMDMDWNGFAVYCAEYGYVTLLEWAKPSIPHLVDLPNIAASRGQILILKWLWDQKYDFTTLTSANAANLEILQFLKKHGCPWSNLTPLVAAMKGRLDVLQWAVEQKCPWSRDDCLKVSIRYPHVVEWILKN
jgi:hypothetical protein